MTATTSETASAPDSPLSVPVTPLSLLRFAFPTMFMMVFYGLYTIVDTISCPVSSTRTPSPP